MAEPTELTRCIESYVDTSRSASEQATSFESIASLVKKGLLTIETLVRELEVYLTTTDNVIRARGTLLLAELLTSLASKPLDTATIHSLIGFFTDRLADWRALRGALVGCLALLKRKGNVGMVSPSDAKNVAVSHLKNLQVQALGQHDRKLCFELLECLLERYPREVTSMDAELLYGICDAFDEEKDPHCLMLVFRIISSLVQQFPSSSALLASFSGSLFETLSCYFPIHFTHKKVEDTSVTREDLSRALMIAFSSTPLFEPHVIPLLLEKLSSSLQSAKVDSLKYLSYCSVKYGASRMEKHIDAIWSLLKSVISDSLLKDHDNVPSESLHGLGFQENEIGVGALLLLETIVKENHDSVISLIVDDEDISTVFNTITSYGSYRELSSEGKQRLHVISCILSITSKTSVASCNRVLDIFFPSLVNILLQPMSDLSKDLNFGALYLCTELLEACMDLILGSRELYPSSVLAREAFCFILHKSCVPLINALCSTLATTSNQAHDVDIYFRVKSLQILATFPEEILPIPENVFESILSTLTSIIIEDFNHTYLWKVSLKALVHIGSFVSGCTEPEKALSYSSIVVEKINSLVSVDSVALPFPLKLEAMCEIGASGRNHMLKIVRGLEGTIFTKMSDFYVNGNTLSAAMAVQLLQCFSNKVIPWACETEGLEEILLHFATSIWDHVQSWVSSDVQVQEEGLFDGIVTVMKLTVGSCSVENQNTILKKAYLVLSTSIPLPMNSVPAQLNGSPLSHHMESVSVRDGLVLSLFVSVVIAAKPKANIPSAREITQLFLTMLLKGHVPSAQALGSMINKFDTKSFLEEAINIIFMEKLWCSHGNLKSNDDEKSLTDLCLGFIDDVQLQIHAIVGLAWVGKGLLLRGHEKVKDVIMILLDCLLPAGSLHSSTLKRVFDPSVTKAAADAFHLLMSDSESCLNRRFHAIIRPLYKQRLFSVVMPILLSSIKESDSDFSRSMLYRASAHVISDAPLIVVLNEAKKVISILLGGLSIFSQDFLDKENLYSLLLVLSGLLTDGKGREAVIENAHSVISCLSGLIDYPHMMLVRETAIQCLVAMSELPHSRIYPMRSKVLKSVSKALDDRKRAVRQEAVRCRQAWAFTAS